MEWRGASRRIVEKFSGKQDILLAESLRIAHDSGALKQSDLARVTVDTTVQPKNITFPTDAKLLLVAIQQRGKLATEHGVELRQSYARVAKLAVIRRCPAGPYLAREGSGATPTPSSSSA
jgi:hypothetical protein